jgi:predicted transcriptional regulator
LEIIVGEKPRLAINAREAVSLFRNGASDVDLMERYNISARSLERLFKKLLDEGEISKSELNQRMFSSGKTHAVDVVSQAVKGRATNKKKVRISAGDVMQSIGSGMSDIELMNKYNLSARGLDRLLRRLVKRGDIEQSELEERKKSFYWADVAFVKSNGQSVEPLDDRDFEGMPEESAFGEFLEEHKVGISACLGAIGGMLATVILIVSVTGVERTQEMVFGTTMPLTVRGGDQEGLDVATDQVIAALESIARNEPMPKDKNPDAKSPEYAKCLADCDREFSRGDGSNKALWFNCRKGCVIRHSSRMKRIRELYHTPAW